MLISKGSKIAQLFVEKYKRNVWLFHLKNKQTKKPLLPGYRIVLATGWAPVARTSGWNKVDTAKYAEFTLLSCGGEEVSFDRY